MRQPNKTIGGTLGQVLHKRDFPKLFIFISHQGNTNLSHNEILFIHQT